MKKLLKKWYFWLIISLIGIFAILSVTVYFVNRANPTLNPSEKDFAITDTSAVTRIFMADKKDNSVLLTRGENNVWTMNDKYAVQPEMLEELLYTLMYVTVRQPVAKSQYETVMKLLAGFSTKVEIYARVHRVDLLGIKLFPYEKCIRTYYVGTSTKDNTGTFMLMEGAEMPYITHIPGFKGYLEPRYSPREADWRSHEVFKYSLNNIAQISVTYPQFSDRSFVLSNTDNLNFKIKTEKGVLPAIDTLRVINYLNSYVDVRFESFLNDLSPAKKDSIKREAPFCILSVTDKQNKTNSISLIRIKMPEGSTNINGDPIEYDPERMFAILNGKDFVQAQFFVFGPLMRYADEFRPNGNKQPQEKTEFQPIF